MIENLSTMDKVIEKPRGFSRRTLVLIGVGAFALLVLALAFPMIARWSRAERSVPAASVRIGEVIRGTLVRDTSAQGRIVASLHPTLFSPAAGIVTLAVKAGSEVKKGQSLARIESPGAPRPPRAGAVHLPDAPVFPLSRQRSRRARACSRTPRT